MIPNQQAGSSEWAPLRIEAFRAIWFTSLAANVGTWFQNVGGRLAHDALQETSSLERKHPDLPMQPGHVLRREFEYIRHGTLSWFINFDVVTGHVLEPSWGPTRTRRMR